MKIDKKLNIIIPLESGEVMLHTDEATGRQEGIPQVKGYVFAMPLALAAFEANYALIARTHTKIFTGGHGVVSGPRTAAMIMRDAAKEMELEDAGASLTNEMKRLASFAHMGKDGWAHIPLVEAISNKLMDEDEWSEVENALAFFIVASAMARKSEIRPILLGMASFWGALPISSSFTEFLNSLPTSTVTAPSTKKAVSSVPG